MDTSSELDAYLQIYQNFLNMALVPFLAEQVISRDPAIFSFNGGATLTRTELGSTSGWPADLSVERIVQTDQAVNFGFKWSVSGILLPFINPSSKWHIQIYFEQLGGGEISLGSYSVRDVAFGPHTHGTRTYSEVLTFPPGVIPEGLYEVVAVIRLMDTAHHPGPVAAFAEMGKVQFYNDSL